ncbi:salivary secreted peptide [Apiospora marii]|uniref:salivary secreted peptide n=1 Tax=Apiospora marii TaxID=335849 RepID=UPI00312D10EC
MNAPVSTVLLRLLMASAATVGGVEASKCRHNTNSVGLSSNSAPSSGTAYPASSTSDAASSASSAGSVIASVTSSSATAETASSSTGSLDSNTDSTPTSTTATEDGISASASVTDLPESLSATLSAILSDMASSSSTESITVTLDSSTSTDGASSTASSSDATVTDSPSDTTASDPTPTATESGASDSTSTSSGGEAEPTPTDTVTVATSIPPSTTTESDPDASTFDKADYTFYEIELPVVFTSTVEGSATPTTTQVYEITQTPTPSCLVDASNFDMAFKIQTNKGDMLIPKNGIIKNLTVADFPSQPPTDPNAPEDPVAGAANEAFFNNLPDYHFQELTEGGTPGFYDLITTDENGATVYVAWNPSTMEMRTTNHSTEGQTPDSDGLITSIFSFSCDGRMVISDASQTVYTWEVSPDGVRTRLVVGAPTDDTMVLLVPDSTPPGYQPNVAASDSIPTKRHARYASTPNHSLLARDANYHEGQLPRVPSYPPNLVSRPRDHVRPMTYNGCGSGSTSSWIPQLNFGHCCDMHDYCYDNCQGGQVELCHEQYCAPGTWEKCNSAFYDCMHNTACPQYSWFWSPIRRALCEKEAQFYAWVVTTYKGAEAFRDAAADRCGAYCDLGGGALQPLCNGNCNSHAYDDANCGACGVTCATGYQFHCQAGRCVCTADIQNDSQNCGGCGNRCPYKTHCSGAHCVCDDETCNNTCVNTKNHPRNCGGCGNVCATGYCFQGQCVDPDAAPTSTGPPQCLPTDAVKNGGFDAGNAPPWQFNPDTIGGFQPITIDYSGKTASISTGNNNYESQFSMPVLSQTITVCPGANYELTFTVHRQTEAPVFLLVSVQGQNVAQLPLYGTGAQGYGPYPFTVPASATGDTFASTTVQFQLESPLDWNTYTIAFDDVSVYQP